jgi:hypothetical protein
LKPVHSLTAVGIPVHYDADQPVELAHKIFGQLSTIGRIISKETNFPSFNIKVAHASMFEI